ncbi:hypothetical protein PCANC_16453 [Puccinia coronata f. sp. avenae]|uniref:Uncharacterized protein n=1 Tax=Puccinia coronata f. sp. avenae TaxID=200324 RepID=A0A2N5U6X2_9BASI|nr:hypothetical protein PCANC_16453 [Puccinia coronata f. sp. avenae]
MSTTGSSSSSLNNAEIASGMNPRKTGQDMSLANFNNRRVEGIKRASCNIQTNPSNAADYLPTSPFNAADYLPTSPFHAADYLPTSRFNSTATQSIPSWAQDDVESEESFKCRGLSWLYQPEPPRPEHRPQDGNTLLSAHDEKKPEKNRNFLGLTLDLNKISNFNLIKDPCKDATQTSSLNPSPEVELRATPAGTSSSSSSACPIQSSVNKSSITMFGSSRLRTLKLERQTQKKNRLRSLKEAFTNFFRVHDDADKHEH